MYKRLYKIDHAASTAAKEAKKPAFPFPTAATLPDCFGMKLSKVLLETPNYIDICKMSLGVQVTLNWYSCCMFYSWNQCSVLITGGAIATRIMIILKISLIFIILL